MEIKDTIVDNFICILKGHYMTYDKKYDGMYCQRCDNFFQCNSSGCHTCINQDICQSNGAKYSR